MKKLRIKRIGQGSFARMLGAIYGAVGAIAGIIFIIVGLMQKRNEVIMLGIGTIIAYPIIGVAMGGLMAWAYNIASKKFGGIEMEIG